MSVTPSPPSLTQHAGHVPWYDTRALFWIEDPPRIHSPPFPLYPLKLMPADYCDDPYSPFQLSDYLCTQYCHIHLQMIVWRNLGLNVYVTIWPLASLKWLKRVALSQWGHNSSQIIEARENPCVNWVEGGGWWGTNCTCVQSQARNSEQIWAKMTFSNSAR